MTPGDVFTSAAEIKIVLPTQLSVETECRIYAATDGLVSIANSQVEVKFNRIIYIRNAFPNGMPEIDTFFIQLSDFINPPTIQPTDPFEVLIFYTENVNEVCHYQGTALTFSAEPSNALTMAANWNNTLTKTGETQNNFTISGTLDIGENNIE